MSDTTATTKDVKEMVRKTWCEGPLTQKVSNNPFLTDIENASTYCNIIRKMLIPGFCR